MSKNALAALIAAKTPTYKPNPHWRFEYNQIVNIKTNEKFDLSLVMDMLDDVVSFFKMNYDSFQSESQVLVLTDADYLKLESAGIPALPYNRNGYRIVVLPQVNTFSNTSISESYWQKAIIGNDITPVMRIHSHHILHAYQSSTDWSTLNSGTLEVVFGTIYGVPEIAYWLDTRGDNTKDIVYKTTDLGRTTNIIPSGKPNPHRIILD